jgi:hypothetical protein
MRLPTGQVPETSGFTTLAKNLDRRTGIWMCASQHITEQRLVLGKSGPRRLLLA